MTAPSPLIHYSDKPLKCPRDTPDPGDKGRPNGLWVSVGDAWLVDQYKRWRKDPKFGSAHYPHWFKYANKITIANDSGILAITNVSEFKAFNDEYSELCLSAFGQQVRLIRWREVRRRYQGIIISPHLDDMAVRINAQGKPSDIPEAIWYSTWVVASGCLWDVSVIENIETSSIALPPY